MLYRVLLVDDEPFMLEGMRLMIDWENHGFTICAEASNAQDALHLMDAYEPHLLITDVRMPGMLGTDLAGIVHHYHPKTILLFYSGYRDFKFAQSAIRSHAFGYLVKPIDKDEVHNTLKAVKAELDGRLNQRITDGDGIPVLRDHVLRRIASGDAGSESLLRAGVLLDLKRGDPCYCAVVSLQEKELTQSVLVLMSNFGGIAFLLTSSLCGICFKQIERDLGRLESLYQCLLHSYGVKVLIGIGSVAKGAEGFERSLSEALDALEVLFEPYGSLRLYKPIDDSVSKWMTLSSLSKVSDALFQDDDSELHQELQRLYQLINEHKPTLLALRYMVKTLEATLLVNNLQVFRPTHWLSRLHNLWQEQNLSMEMWLLEFDHVLRSLKKEIGKNDAYPPAVRTVLDILNRDYAKNRSLGDIADQLDLNPAYLGQMILRTIGKTYHALLLDIRLSNACRMLRQTTCTVGEISYAVGFRDVDYFSRQFRARMAMSPIAYRGASFGKED